MVLILAEKLLLLALHDEKGTELSASSTALPTGLAGAVLQDLALRGRISLDASKKIRIIDASPTGDGILDEAMAMIRESAKEKDAKHWVTKLSGGMTGLKARLLDRLIEKGILKREERRLLWVFPADRFPTHDPRPEWALRERVRGILLRNAARDTEILALISLIEACDLVNEIFSREERKAAKEKIKVLAEGEEMAKSVNAAVADVTAAIAGATAVAVILAATSTTSSGG